MEVIELQTCKGGCKQVLHKDLLALKEPQEEGADLKQENFEHQSL